MSASDLLVKIVFEVVAWILLVLLVYVLVYCLTRVRFP